MLRYISALVILQSGAAWGASPWLPGSGKASVNLTYVEESFTSYWHGRTQRTFPQPPSPATVIDQHTGYASFEYGLSNKLALDLLTDYTEPVYGAESLQRLADNQVGLREQLYNGERSVLTLRGAANIGGTYDLTTKSRFSPGDKASGGQGSLLYGAALGRHFHLYGEGGYRYRENIPNV